MSPADQQWDEAIRQAVETHEFEYEPAAWAGMEQLLDAAPPLPPAGAAAKGFSFWVWVLSAGLAGGLLWYALRPTALMPVSPPEESAPVLAPTQSEEQQVPFAPLAPPSAPKHRQAPPASAPSPALAEPEPEPDWPTARQSWPVPRPLPSLLLPQQLRHQRADTLPTLLLPPGSAPSRKRDRKTLFPDVIENY
jgi:hypothetical protein